MITGNQKYLLLTQISGNDKKLQNMATLTNEQYGKIQKELQAAQRRLGSPKKTLEWFLFFAEKDLARLSEAELLLDKYNLLSTSAGSWFTANMWTVYLNAFITRSTDLDDPAFFTKPLNIQTLKRIQRGINQALADLFSEHGVWDFKPSRWYSDGLKRLSATDAKNTEIEVFKFTASPAQTIIRGGFLRAVVEGVKFLRGCKRCRKAFVANKRQEYCSLNCSQIERNEKKKRLKEEARKTGKNK